MYCSNCGKENEKDAKFCAFCGVSISGAIKDKKEPSIKCGNCDYVGQGEYARNKSFNVLAWVVVFVAPLLTIIYFLSTSKYRCPKCKSTFLGIKNKEGVYTAQKGRSRGVVWLLVVIVLSIAIVGILAGIVLAALNTARHKGRDAQRVADIGQIRVALENYYEKHSTYPANLKILETSQGALFKDPQGNPYNYTYCSANSYHLGASLEGSSHNVLTNDADKILLCDGDNILGSDDGKCASSDSGGYCYDVVSWRSSLSSDTSTQNTYTYYTNSLANVRTCASITCDAVVQYPQNTPFTLPYHPSELPEWVKIQWQDTTGDSGFGYMSKSVLSINLMGLE